VQRNVSVFEGFLVLKHFGKVEDAFSEAIV
jgi:hypothetical protein